MAHLQYPTSASVNPPLFLSKEKLLELDKIIADHLPQIEAENERYIEADFEKYYGSSVGASPEKAKKYLEERRQERKISLTLHFKNGTELHANSFREAARHTEINSAPAEGFALAHRTVRWLQGYLVTCEIGRKQLHLNRGSERGSARATCLICLCGWHG
jgi:hypothetical protein